jgi:hypothetical protein
MCAACLLRHWKPRGICVKAAASFISAAPSASGSVRWRYVNILPRGITLKHAMENTT